MAKLVLGIETSGILCSVAWVLEDRILLEYNIEMPNIHATLLPDLISEGLNKLKIKNEDINLVAVALGPGSFTGLRIGMSYAKGFCYGLKKPIVGVTNFEVLANQAPINFAPVYTLINAQRGKYYLGIFQDGINLYKAELITIDQIVSRVNEKSIILLNEMTEDMYNELIKVSSYIVKAGYSGSLICKSGLNKFNNHGADDLELLEPFYLQKFAGVK